MPSQLAGATVQSLPELQKRVQDFAVALERVEGIQVRLQNAVDRLIPRQPRAVPSHTETTKDIRTPETLDAKLAWVVSAIQAFAGELQQTAEDLDRAV